MIEEVVVVKNICAGLVVGVSAAVVCDCGEVCVVLDVSGALVVGISAEVVVIEEGRCR